MVRKLASGDGDLSSNPRGLSCGKEEEGLYNPGKKEHVYFECNINGVSPGLSPYI
jgi:hypothetical protein